MSILQCRPFLPARSPTRPKTAKFPDNREFLWRRVRSALRRQPGIRAFPRLPKRPENRLEIRAFRVSVSVSVLLVQRPQGGNRRKSPALSGNIPVLRMVHVDDLIEPGAKQILLARLPPFPWSHLVLSRSRDTKENHESDLQGIPFRMADIRQIRFPQIVGLRFKINGLGILHGRPVSSY